MPAEIEEVVVYADALELQNLRPDLGEALLELVARLLVIRIRVRRQCFRCWQGLTVELAVRGHREGFQDHVRRWQHIVRQSLPQVSAQYGCFGLQAGLTGHVSHQALVPILQFAHQHKGLAHRLVAGQQGLDLSRFDPETAYFHLVVVTPQEFDIAVLAIAHPVATAVEPFALDEGAGNETLGAQCLTPPVTPREPVAANVSSPGTPTGTGFPNRSRT